MIKKIATHSEMSRMGCSVQWRPLFLLGLLPERVPCSYQQHSQMRRSTQANRQPKDCHRKQQCGEEFAGIDFDFEPNRDLALHNYLMMELLLQTTRLEWYEPLVYRKI